MPVETVRDFVRELFQVIDRHVLEIDLLGTVDVGGISEDANGHPRPGDIWESVNANQIPVGPEPQTPGSLDGSGETLVSLGIVVFQTDLQFDGLDEVAAFFG